MISIGSAGGVPAGPSVSSILSRGCCFSAAGILAGLNAQADQILASFASQTALSAIVTLGGVSAVIWAAMAATWKIGLESAEPIRGARDLSVLLIVVLLSFVPVSYAAQLGVLLCGSYLLITSPARGPERRAAAILFALTGPLIWGRVLLHAFEGPILSLDAHLVGAAIGTRVDGNIVPFVGGGGHFVLLGACSSVHNMSLAIVLWTVSAMLFRLRIDRNYLLIGIGMAAFMFALNIVRLSAMGLFPAQFDFLHYGTGAVLFSWAGLMGAGLLAFLGVCHAARQQ